MSVQEVFDQILHDKPFFEESGGGITLSGGEPLAQAEFCLEILRKCRQAGIHTAVDTSGYAPVETIRKFMPLTDLFLFDLKLINPLEHEKHTSCNNRLILENFRLLHASGSRIILRIPLVEGITDTPLNLGQIRQFLSGFSTLERIDLLPYHCIARGKYQKLGLPYSLEQKQNYDIRKACQLRETFSDLARLVTVGG